MFCHWFLYCKNSTYSFDLKSTVCPGAIPNKNVISYSWHLSILEIRKKIKLWQYSVQRFVEFFYFVLSGLGCFVIQLYMRHNLVEVKCILSFSLIFCLSDLFVRWCWECWIQERHKQTHSKNLKLALTLKVFQWKNDELFFNGGLMCEIITTDSPVCFIPPAIWQVHVFDCLFLTEIIIVVHLCIC